MSEIFKTILSETESEYKDRGSRFIAYAFPINSVDEVKEKISSQKKNNPKARHHCYAYRIGNDKTIFRTVDDGEPSGTAGLPILGQIDSFGITNVLIVVVRYFGGTLLGKPGLIKAYREAAKAALSKAEIIERKKLYELTIQFPFSVLPEILSLLKKHKVKILEHEYFETCIVKIECEKEVVEMLGGRREIVIA